MSRGDVGRPLPKVVITTTASVDGRVALGRSSRLMQPDAARRWAVMKPDGTDAELGARRDEYAATVTLEGSGSFIGDEDPPVVLPTPTMPESELRQDFLPRRAPHWFVVADSRGRVDWSFAGDDTTALVVLVCSATPTGYLQLLRDRGIGHLSAGADRVDLEAALATIGTALGASTVVADSGGTFNAGLLKAGLVDEIDVVTLPGLVGGVGTPSIMDGEPLDESGTPIRLELIDCRVTDAGLVRTRYRVCNEHGPKADTASP
ncbi:MAG: dihydrofolate reductase family protein [Micropruina sp.]|uniref:dihydrofolate reductase family protein n=1 Tax=Micropruina sp. TaxID=2737536 RepID=UPI0039E29B57